MMFDSVSRMIDQYNLNQKVTYFFKMIQVSISDQKIDYIHAKLLLK